MKKKYLIISILIVTVIIISGSYLYILYNEGISICKEASPGTAIIVGEAFTGIDNCNMIGNNEIRCKYLCIEYVASNQKSEALCERILQINSLSTPNKPFYDECLKMVGSEKSDENLCKNIENDEQRNECLRNAAQTQKDENICKQIPTTTFESTHFHDDCLSEIAIAKKDVSICEMIVDEPEKSECSIMVEQISH